MRIQLLGEFSDCLRALLFLLYSFGVFGVGSELVTYLPVNIDPPFLDTRPRVLSTGAMLPALVAPALAFSIISRISMMYPQGSLIDKFRRTIEYLRVGCSQLSGTV